MKYDNNELEKKMRLVLAQAEMKYLIIVQAINNNERF